MKFVLLALLLLLPFASHAGQLSSDFRGKIVDSHGLPVAGAIMLVEHVETGRITRHVANGKGRWHAIGKRSDGTYRVSCYAPGSDVPAVRFEGRVALGQTHLRNCVIGQVGAHSPSWLSSWQWRQAPGERYVLH